MTFLRVTSFRAALVFTLLLVATLALILGLLYAVVQQQLRQAEDRLVWREVADLSRIHQTQGVRALGAAVTSRGQAATGLYVRLSSTLGVYLAGHPVDFPSPEMTQHSRNGWFSYTHEGMPLRARLLRLDDDLVLLIGQDVSNRQALLRRLVGWFIAALIGLTGLGLGGATLLARRNLARVAELNDHLQSIIDGRLTDRLAMAHGNDEWALMAAHINTMLDRLQSLLASTRQVSDNLAHDLRAPLTRLKAQLETLLEQANDVQRDQFADALDDVDALLRSFSALLTLSRLDSGAATLHCRPVDVAAMLRRLHELFEAVFAAQDMKLQLDNAPVGGFHGEEKLLTQALVNLLENALRYGSRAGSVVRLSAQMRARELVLSVADEGPGIAEMRRDEAVKRFVRLDESRSGEGSGLGLAMVSAICVHHGGKLELDHNTPGHNTQGHNTQGHKMQGLVASMVLPHRI